MKKATIYGTAIFMIRLRIYPSSPPILIKMKISVHNLKWQKTSAYCNTYKRHKIEMSHFDTSTMVNENAKRKDRLQPLTIVFSIILDIVFIYAKHSINTYHLI